VEEPATNRLSHGTACNLLLIEEKLDSEFNDKLASGILQHWFFKV
jgi:hypothetical protein